MCKARKGYIILCKLDLIEARVMIEDTAMKAIMKMYYFSNLYQIPADNFKIMEVDKCCNIAIPIMLGKKLC